MRHVNQSIRRFANCAGLSWFSLGSIFRRLTCVAAYEAYEYDSLKFKSF